MRELMGAHKTRQKHKKLNSDITTSQIDRGDERFEGRWVVKLADGRFGCYGKEKDDAEENPIVAS